MVYDLPGAFERVGGYAAVEGKRIYTIEIFMPCRRVKERTDRWTYLLYGAEYDASEDFKYSSRKIGNYIDSNKGNEVFAAPFGGIWMRRSNTWCGTGCFAIQIRDKLDDCGDVGGAPDWIIEDVSPASRRMDYYTKLLLNTGLLV